MFFLTCVTIIFVFVFVFLDDVRKCAVAALPGRAIFAVLRACVALYSVSGAVCNREALRAVRCCVVVERSRILDFASAVPAKPRKSVASRGKYPWHHYCIMPQATLSCFDDLYASRAVRLARDLVVCREPSAARLQRHFVACAGHARVSGHVRDNTCPRAPFSYAAPHARHACGGTSNHCVSACTAHAATKVRATAENASTGTHGNYLTYTTSRYNTTTNSIIRK